MKFQTKAESLMSKAEVFFSYIAYANSLKSSSFEEAYFTLSELNALEEYLERQG
jgi:hypothetical protein